MGGRKSRIKGKTGEYEVRDYFRSLGYTANRVPSSGAAQGFKGDVHVTNSDGENFLVEVKRRKNAFKSIYQVDAMGVISFAYKGHLLAISKDFRSIKDSWFYSSVSPPNLYLDRLIKLKALLGEAKYLVVRDDNKPWLFISFK